MIGVICALEEELDEIKKLITNIKNIQINNLNFITGLLNNIECVLVLCGVGKVHAAISCQTMILKFNPDLILNIGVAGALTPELEIGDIIIATGAIQHDFDVSAFPNRKKGEISGLNKILIESTPWITSKLFNINKNNLKFKINKNIILTGDQFISQREDKIKLSQEFGGIICDMEAGSIAQTCYINNTDFGIIRAVSDSLNNNSVYEFEEFVNISSKNCAQIFKKFINILDKKQMVIKFERQFREI